MNRLIAALALTLMTAALGSAEETPERRNTVSIHPFMSFLVSGVDAHWEHAFGEGLWSAEIPLTIGYMPDNGSRLGFGLGLRRYLEPGATGWYAAPRVQVIDWNNFAVSEDRYDSRNLWVLTTARAGYKWDLGRLSLDGSLGGGYLKDYRFRETSKVFDIFQPDWTPVASLTAGWAF